MKFFIFIALLGLLPFAGMAQYYPPPQPIDYRQETELLVKLKNAKPDLSRVRVQLELCQHITFKSDEDFCSHAPILVLL